MSVSSKWLNPSFLKQKPYAFLFSPIHATQFAHIILLDFISSLTFGEEKNCEAPH
jgi:hypothetical protein